MRTISGHILFAVKILVILLIHENVFSQQGTGLPVWTVSNTSSRGLQVFDWRNDPCSVKSFAIPSPSIHCPSIPAVSACGDPVFYVRHSGAPNASHNLFIYSPEGTVLLGSSTPNGPGLNAKRTGYEFQVVKVPGTLNEWYIIYPMWVTDVGAPIGSGGYVSSNLLYSRVKYYCNSIEVMERDVVLQTSGTAYKYSTSLAVAATTDPGLFYIYAHRRTEGSNNLSLDRFRIENDGISWDKNTGNIAADFSIFAIDASPLCVSNDGKRIALCNRNDGIDEIDFIIFDAEDFSNAPGSCIQISAGDLILQPDNQVLFSAIPVQMAANIPGLEFLQHMERKLVHITFSPSGKYLYFTHGGFNGGGGNSNTYTYLGQMETGTYDDPEPYPYKLRLQIEIAPGSAEFDATRHIQQCFDGNYYFIKWSSPYLYVLPDPDSPLPNNLIPYHIDLSDGQHPNIPTLETIWYSPEQIDGYDYITAERPEISIGNDTILCTGNNITLTPGNGFITYCWQDGSSGEEYTATNPGEYWVEIMDANGCFARDTIEINFLAEEISLGDDRTICEDDSVYLSAGSGFTGYLWQNGSTQQGIFAGESGLYWVEATASGGCKARDSVFVNVNPLPSVYIGQDTSLAPGETLLLDAGEGFDNYLWQDGSFERYFEVGHEGEYWVTVMSNYCSAADTINILYDDCSANIFAPNCFTPNGDGYNEQFTMTATNIDQFTLYIFNRW